MATAKASAALRSQFTRISKDVYLVKPSSSTGANTVANAGGGGKTVAPPDCILLFGWMGASLTHVDKYAQGWRALYPTAPILLVRSHPAGFLARPQTVQRRMEPIAEWLRAELGSDSMRKQGGLLVHTMSNGGALGLQIVNKLMKERADSSSNSDSAPLLVNGGLPARAIIFDSCPGSTRLDIMVRAFTAPLAKSIWIARWGASAVVACLYAVVRISDLLHRRPPKIERVAAELNATLPVSASRLYLYSDVDALIPPEAVESHAAVARQMGVKHVQLECFKGSPHVSHARSEPARYWECVKRLWEVSSVQE